MQILNEQHVDIQDKIFIIKVIFTNASVRDIQQKIYRFNSSWRIFNSSGSILDSVSIHNLTFSFFCRLGNKESVFSILLLWIEPGKKER